MFRIRLQPLVAAVIIMAAKMEARWESIKRTSLLCEDEETGDYFSCPVLLSSYWHYQRCVTECEEHNYFKPSLKVFLSNQEVFLLLTKLQVLNKALVCLSAANGILLH